MPVLSDECYAEFTWDGAPDQLVQHGDRGGARRALAVEALEPGRRARRVLRRRRRAGRVPGRDAQARRPHGAGPGRRPRRPWPWTTTPMWSAQRGAIATASPVWPRSCGSAGLEVAMPAGGFYLWVPVPAWAEALGAAEGRAGAWVLTTALAESAGMLVSPGRVLRRSGGGVRAHRRGPARRPHRVGGDAPGGVGPPRPDGGGPVARRAVRGGGRRRGPVTSGDGRPARPDRRAVVPGGRAAAPADTDAERVVTEAIDLLDRGEARVAETDGDGRRRRAQRGSRPPSSCCSGCGPWRASSSGPSSSTTSSP